ncbi:MAG: hypothetical protein WBL63_15725 [Candidatus Acidiferrum sp.]
MISQRRERRQKAKLPHHSAIIPIREVLGYLAIDHPVHVDVLHLEAAPGGYETVQELDRVHV